MNKYNVWFMDKRGHMDHTVKDGHLSDVISILVRLVDVESKIIAVHIEKVSEEK